jgi:membrane protein DedA with SNARE-associated domain
MYDPTADAAVDVQRSIFTNMPPLHGVERERRMFAHLILRYGYAVIFVAAAAEGDATLLTATFLARRGYLHLDLVMLVAASATIAVNQAYFWVGRRYGPMRLAAMREHGASRRVVGWVEQHGLPLVVGSRFVYGFRIAIPAACGATRMAPWTFSLGDVVGSMLWVGVIGGGGYAIGHILTILVDDLRTHEWWIGDLLFFGVLILLARHGRDLSLMRLLKARITAAEP